MEVLAPTDGELSLRAHLGCLKRFLVLLLTRHALAVLLAVLAPFSVLSGQATSSQTAPQGQTSQEPLPTAGPQATIRAKVRQVLLSDGKNHRRE